MQRDVLKSIKEFMHSFAELKNVKITQKNLSDGNLMMELLSLLDYRYFNPGQLSTRPIQRQPSGNKKQFKGSLVLFQKSVIDQTNKKTQKQLDLLTKLSNWKCVIKSIKEYFRQEHDKGVKYGDIDIVDLSKNHAIEEIAKVFELVLCVVANCGYKEECIQKIMELESSTQQILAQLMSTALENRLCSVQNQDKTQLLQQLSYKEQQLNSLYRQIQRLEEQSLSLQQTIAEYEKTAAQVEYEKQKYTLINKRNAQQQQQQIQTFDSILQKIDEPSFFQPNNNSLIKEQSLQQASIFIDASSQQHLPSFYNKVGSIHLIESLKNKLLKSEQLHQQQVTQYEQKILVLEEKIRQNDYFEELLIMYQQKYQQALTYVEKVSQYQKEKNKVYEEMVEKDVIIEELTLNIQELNQRLVEIEQEKIDLQILLKKKNTEKLQRRNNTKTYCNLIPGISKINQEPQEPVNQSLLLHQTQPQLTKRAETLPYGRGGNDQQMLLQNSGFNLNNNNSQLSMTHKSQQILNQYTNKLSLSMYPYMEEQQSDSYKLSQLQIKIQTQTLQIKRLLRKEKQITKHNENLKAKLNKMRHLQNQNTKLTNIILELHSRKNQETQILMGCLYETYKEFDFRFNKLVLPGTKGKLLIEGKNKLNFVTSNGFNKASNQHQEQHIKESTSKLNENMLLTVATKQTSQSNSFILEQESMMENSIISSKVDLG